jgi:hypothetical protein
MTFCNLSGFFRYCAATAVVCGVFGAVMFAQGPSLDAPRPSAAAASVVVVTPSSFGGEHKFWDEQNRALFLLSGAMNTADFAVTRANLQNGGRELNPMVRVFGRSTPGLAVNFAGETVGVIGLSYFFHKTGHHKLERIVSVVNIGSSATAVGYGLAHR